MYDAATDSLLTKYMVLVTETASYIVELPKTIPCRSWSISNHTTETVVAWQARGGDDTFCYKTSYEPPILTHLEEFYMSYPGEV
eukprot:2636332-Amphidinium_carterae.2